MGEEGLEIKKIFMRLDVPWESFTQVFSLMISLNLELLMSTLEQNPKNWPKLTFQSLQVVLECGSASQVGVLANLAAASGG